MSIDPSEMKLMMGVFGAGDRGKTETLLLLIDLLARSECYRQIVPPSANLDGEKDRIAIFEKSGFRIGISSIGDYGAQVDKAVRELVRLNCHVIVTATRTRGETVNVFQAIRKEHGYEEAWYEKDHNVNSWCHQWPAKSDGFNAMKQSMFNQKNMLDANFLYSYIHALSKMTL